jgi:hypothetical protein
MPHPLAVRVPPSHRELCLSEWHIKKIFSLLTNPQFVLEGTLMECDCLICKRVISLKITSVKTTNDECGNVLVHADKLSTHFIIILSRENNVPVTSYFLF